MHTESHQSSTLPRRRFLSTGAAALGLAPMAFLRAAETSANDEIAIGIIGCGGRGMNNLTNFLGIKGVRIVAVCDVDSKMASGGKAKVDGHYKNTDCTIYPSYPDLLQHSGLDAVAISTPDHWHAQIGIHATNAGLDVYGEKPFSWGLGEGRQLINSIKRNKRIWQTGSQQRSGGEFRRFRAVIQNGTIGKITRVECGAPPGMSINQHVPADQIDALIGKPPANLDWPTWCGPGGEFTYHPLIHPGNWRWHNNFGGGQLMDWVGHHVDIALWTLGLDHTGPTKVEASGEHGNHPFFNTYVKYSYTGTFANGQVVEARNNLKGTKITGDNGWLSVDRGQLNASDREMLRNVPKDFNERSPNHWQNFIDSVRSRKQPIAHAEGSHRSASFGQLAIVAMDTKQPVNWNPEREEIIDNPTQAKHPRLGSRVKV